MICLVPFVRYVSEWTLGTEVVEEWRCVATNVTTIYHLWSSKCFQVMAIAEKILAVADAGERNESDLERLEAEVRGLIAESGQIRDGIDERELKRIAHRSLEAAESLRAVIERIPEAAERPLNRLYDEFADQAETFALSVDPEIRADREGASAEAARGESIEWERLREPAG